MSTTMMKRLPTSGRLGHRPGAPVTIDGANGTLWGQNMEAHRQRVAYQEKINRLFVRMDQLRMSLVACKAKAAAVHPGKEQVEALNEVQRCLANAQQALRGWGFIETRSLGGAIDALVKDIDSLKKPA